MNIIAKFEYNNKTYVFYNFNNNLKVKYGFLALDRSVIEISNEEEIKMMKIIAKQVFISYDKKNHIKLEEIKYNNKSFQMMYDKSSRLKFFYEVKENGLYLPSLEDINHLIRIFNYSFTASSNKTFSIKEFLQKHPFFQKIVYFSKRAILVTFVSLMMFSSVNAKLENEYAHESGVQYVQISTESTDLYENNEDYVYSKSTIEFSIEKIVETIESNKYLTEEEKKFMKDYIDILRKNREYVNMEFLLNTLINLDFVYEEGYDEIGLYGSYYYIDHDIVIYNSSDLSTGPYVVEKHEGYHAVSMQNDNCSDALGVAFVEGMTQTLAEESSFNTPNFFVVYEAQTAYTRMLCEILGPKPLMASYISGNKDYIINALYEIIPDEEKAYRLLSAMDTDKLYSEIYNMTGDVKTRAKELKQEVKEIIFYNINDYFYTKFGYPMTLDAIMMLYYQSAYAKDVDIKLKLLNIQNDSTYFSYPILKGYFVDSFIQDYPEATTTVEYLQSLNGEGSWGNISSFNDATKKIQITDENRRLLPIQTRYGEYLLKVEDTPKQKG